MAPNGSRLSCGRDPPAGARVWDAVRAPPGAQHSGSFKAITARQLQALVRRPDLQGNATDPALPVASSSSQRSWALGTPTLARERRLLELEYRNRPASVQSE